MNKTCYLVFLTLVVDLISFTVILPLIPSIFDYYEQNDKTNVYNNLINKITYFQNLINAPSNYNKVFLSGFIGSWFSLLQFFSSPIIGSLSDLYGRRICLLLTSIGMIFCYFFWSLSVDSFLIFLISRTIGGLSKGNISLSTAIMADLLEPKQRGKGMALIGLAFSIGFIVGPTLGGFFIYSLNNKNKFNYFPPIFSLILSIINFALIYFKFNETLPIKSRTKSLEKSIHNAFDYINPISLFLFKPVKKLHEKDRKILIQTGKSYFLFLFFYSGLEYTLTFLTHIHFNFTSMQQGKVYFFCGLIMVFIQGFILRRFKNEREFKISKFGIVCSTIAFVLMGCSQSINQLYISLFFYSIASATVVPSLTTIASNLGNEEQKGAILGIFRSLGALARSLGPILASFLFWKFGSAICYILEGCTLLIPFILINQIERIS